MSAYTNKLKNRKWIVAGAFALPLISVCQNAPVAAQAQDEGMANPLLWFMLISIILLAFAIAALGGAVRNITGIARIREAENKQREENKNNGAKTLGLLLIFTLAGHSMFSGNTVYTGQETIGGLQFSTFYFLLAVIIIELIFLAVLANVMNGLLAPYKKLQAKLGLKKEKTIMDKVNASVDIEKEADILLDHNYDGIKELDNNLPPWWKYGFYLTIVFAFAYMIHYHITETGDLQVAELNKITAIEKAKVDEYLKNSANNVDENTVKYLDSPADLAAGKEAYTSKPCQSCHGAALQGNIGPNLTDDYWIHGGSIQDIFKTLKYGWPEKGMQAWKDELSPMQIAQVASYIKSLRGTNPSGAKAKEGELYVEAGATASDTTAAVKDTVNVVPADTVKKK